MKKIISRLREKPDHVKTRFAILFALIATLVIVGVWVLITRSIKSNDDTIKTQSPFSIFSEIFQTAISDIKNQPSVLPSPSSTEPTTPLSENDIETQNQPELIPPNSEASILFSPTGNVTTSSSLENSQGIPAPVLSE